MVNTVDSNSTSLSIAEEVYGTPGTLSSPVWYKMQPNSYGEFGGNLKLLARTPIVEGRQNSKGVAVDKDSAVAFQNDFTQSNLEFLLPGFFFADWRRKGEQVPSAVSATIYSIAATAGFNVGDLVFGQGFAVTGNNGLKILTAVVSNTSVAAAGLASETPAATAKLTKVGARGGSGDVTLTVSGTTGTIASTTLDFTTLGVIAGEWIYVGGDIAVNAFATAANRGFYRVFSVAAHSMVCDIIPDSAATDVGSAKLIDIYVGHVIRNEDTIALIKKRSYSMERYLTTSQYETIAGCYCGSLGLSIKVADKVTADMAFIGTTVSYATAAEATGTRPAVIDQSAFNATSNAVRVRLLNDTTKASLFTYITDLSLKIDNNLAPVKAVSVLGNLDVSAGNFTVEGNTTAFFTSYGAVQAVQNNTDVSFDFAIARANAGWLFDLPLVSLGQAQITVEKDKPITLPISTSGARHPTFTHTLLCVQFRYLPTAIAP